MKHTLALLIALLPATAMATGVSQRVDIDVHTYSKAQASAQARAQASAFGLGVGYGGAGGNATGGNATATGGDTTVITESGHHPVSSAIAPSVSNAITCPIATQESKAISLLFLSVSGTTGVMFHGLCYALERGDFATADAMMCDADKNYAKANPACKK